MIGRTSPFCDAPFAGNILSFIAKRIRNLINMFASAGLNTHQATNDDLRIILDNFLNGGQTTTFGTVIG